MLLCRTSNILFFEQRETKKVGLLVIGADMGLAGAYNKDIISATNRFLKKYDPSQVELMLVGRKMVEYYKRRQWPIRLKMIGWGEKTTKEQVRDLSGQMVDWFLKGEFDEIWFVYTHYITMTLRKVVVSKFLNIEEPSTEKKFVPINYIFEPSAEEIYGEILMRYCFTTVQNALHEGYASELAARIFAMKAASTNADDIIEKLTLVRNKVRQGSITREVIEITSGAEREKQQV